MAKIGLKQLDTTLSGSLQVSGSSIVTGSLTVTQLGRFSDVQVTDDLNVTDDVGIGGVLTATGGTVLGNADSDTHIIIGHVTSSGNISSSAAIISSEVTASNAKVTGTLTVHDDVVVGEYVSHKGDANTRINFTDDRIQLEAGGINFFGAHKKASSPHLFTINNGSNNIDFQVKDNSNNTLFRTDADSQLVRFPDALIISGSSTATASFGTYMGDGSQLTGITSVTAESIQNLNAGIISGSQQLPSGIVSASVLSSGEQGTITLTNNGVATNVDSGLQVGDSPTFAGLTSTGDVIIQGKLTAEVYAVSSSVTHMTRSFSSGSTIFGDDITDTHEFTGSILISGSLVDTNIISGSSQLPSGIISGSAQLPSGVISGSSQLPSGIISGSTQIFSAVTSSGNISSSANIIGNQLVIGGGTFTSASLAAGGGGDTDYNGNRRVLNTNLTGLFSASFNPGTSGSIQQFLDAVFYPNTPPSLSGSNFVIDEFIDSGSVVGTITATDAEALSSEVSFSTQSSYSDDFFKIHSGSGQITTNTSTSASMNTTNRGDGQLAHPFLVEVSDTITTSAATVFIRVTPNTAPNFRTTSIGGSIITSNTGSVNENTTSGTTILTFFVTDEESDTITISPLSQSAATRFSSSFSDVAGGKQIVLKTATGSFDFETIQSHELAISASDEHHGNTSGSYLTTLPILVNVTDNNAPTMASQVFSINESSGSHTQHGLGTSTNSLTTVGTITTNDTEGDTVTFTALTLTSGSGGGNTSQTNPSNNPFQVASNGTLQLKAGQYLNSDIFNQYTYSATYRDNFNAESSSGVITVNITDDPIPTLTNNAGDTFNGQDLFYIIESATNGDAIRVNSNGRTGTQADFNSNETVYFMFTGSQHISINNSSGNLSVGTTISGSDFKFDNTSYLSGSVTASNAFGTMTSSLVQVKVQINNAPTPSFSNSTANGFLNSNEARANTNNLSTITFSDTEGDSLNHNTFIFTDPSGQLTTVKSGDSYFVRAQNNLSGSTTYQMTASIKDEHGFRTGTTENTFTISAADIGTLGGDVSSSIIESAVSGASVTTATSGIAGTVADLDVSYTNGSNFGNQSVQSFSLFESDGSTPHNFLTSSAAGGISIKSNISASSFVEGSHLTSSVKFQDQYQNIGSGSIRVDIKGNSAPTASFTNNSTFLNSNEARPGNKLLTIGWSDAESDSLNHNTFTFTDPSGQLSSSRSGDDYEIFPKTNLSGSVASGGSTTYQVTASIKDEHGFETGTGQHTFTIATADLGTLTTNGTFYIIESALSSSNIFINSNGRSGTQGDLGVTYLNSGFGSPSVQAFSVFEADKSTPHQFITSSAAGGLSIKSNISGSGRIFGGSALTASVVFQDQYQNVGSGSITLNVAKNNPPSITLSPSSQTLSAEKSLSGSFICSASFSDTESDTVNFDTFAFGGTHGSLFSAKQSGNAMIINANTDLSASNYSFSVTVKDQHGFHTSDASNGSLTVTPMFYFYKNTNVLVLDGSEGTAITQLGDAGGDDVGVTSGSFMGQLKSGKIGDSTITEAGGQQMLLVASQSLNHLASSGSGFSTFRQFGNIALNGNSDNGHQFIVLYPSSSQVFQKPNSLRAGLGGSTAREFTVFNDNSSSDQAVTAGLHYFSTDTGVKIFGNDRWGMIFALDASTNPTQFYHLLSSSGSAPSSEV